MRYHQVQAEANSQGDAQLDEDQQEQFRPAVRDSQQHGDGLVAGGNKDCHQSAQGDDPAAVQAGSHGRKATLRNCAQQSAHSSSPAAALGEQRFYPAAASALDPFDQQVGQIEEGQHFQAVQAGIQ